MARWEEKHAILIAGLKQLCTLLENGNQAFKEGEPHSSLTALKHLSLREN